MKLISCPRCGARAPYSSDHPWRPFCSERCRTIDLGAWATESYRIPVPDTQADEVADAEPDENQR